MASRAPRFGRNPYEHSRKSASRTGSITSFTAAWTTRSLTAGMPRPRCCPGFPGFGMYTRRTGCGRYRFSRSSASSSSSTRSTPYASTAATVCLSTPALPRFRRTPLPRLLQHIASIDLVVHHAELPLRRHLGRPIQLPLEYPHRFTSRVLSPGGNHAVPPPRESIAEAGALCSGRVTALRRSYDPLRPLGQASLGASASGLISSVPTTRVGGPGEVSSLLPLRCPCMLPPSPREPRRVRIPDSSPADISLRPTTGGSATPLPALAAISAGSTLTAFIGRSRLL